MNRPTVALGVGRQEIMHNGLNIRRRGVVVSGTLPCGGVFFVSCAPLFQEPRHRACDGFFRLLVKRRTQAAGIEFFNLLCQSAHVPR